MDITDADGLWRITDRQIENRKTGEIKRLNRTPSANTIAHMPHKKFLSECAIAFATGKWPKS